MFERKEPRRGHHTKGQLQLALGIGAVLMTLAYLYREPAQPIVPQDFKVEKLQPDTVVFRQMPPPPPSGSR